MEELHITENVGKRLRSVREALKLSARSVSLEIGKSQNFINYIESGQTKDPGICAVAKICAVYDITLDALMYYSDEEFVELLNDIRVVDI